MFSLLEKTQTILVPELNARVCLVLAGESQPNET